MTTINEITERIAFSLGDPFNHTLKEAIKHTIIITRPKIIKNHLSRNPMDYLGLLYPLRLDMETVQLESRTGVTHAHRATEVLPKALYTPNFSRNGIFSVTNDGGVPFVYVTNLYELEKARAMRYTHNVNYYSVVEGKIEVYDQPRIRNLTVTFIPTDLTELNNGCSIDTFTENSDIFMPDELVGYLETGMLNGDFPIRVLTDGKEVDIKERQE